MRNRTCRIGRAGTLPGLLLLLASAAIAPGAARAETGRAPAAQPSPGAVRASLAAARVPFLSNEGQIPDAGVKFYARTFAGTVFVTSRADLVYALPVAGREHAIWAFRESFVGHRPTRVRGGAPSAVRVGVYKGPDPAAWRPRLETFDGIDLGELYPGVRATLRAAGDNVEKRFHIAPGADARAIEVEVDGVDSLAVDSGGRLVAKTAMGDVLLTAPVAYQTVDGARRPVEVAYALADGNRYGFRLGAHDPDREVVIDPLLAATYLGGHNPNPPGNYDDDWIYDLLTVGDDVYVGGVTQSPDFPIVLGYDDTLDNAYPDGFVARLSGDLTQVIASTYIGTPGFDRVAGLAARARWRDHRRRRGRLRLPGDAGRLHLERHDADGRRFRPGVRRRPGDPRVLRRSRPAGLSVATSPSATAPKAASTSPARPTTPPSRSRPVPTWTTAARRTASATGPTTASRAGCRATSRPSSR